MATTPSASTFIRTPRAPLHGFADSWEPFSPRKSARLSSKRAAVNRTPSPQSSSLRPDFRQQSENSLRKSETQAKVITGTPAPSPRKKHMPTMGHIDMGFLAFEADAEATASLGPSSASSPKKQELLLTDRPGLLSNGMLFTPDKTPMKGYTEKKAAIKKVARNLFSAELDIMPSTKKASGSKYQLNGIPGEDEGSFEIFTDSHERLPEIDQSADNPFYGDKAVPAAEPGKRRSLGAKKTVHVPGVGRMTVEQAVQRDDGIVITFRGKHQFRLFNEGGSQSDADDDDDGPVRSSLKPKLLFPAKKERASPEEAPQESTTDVEDHDGGKKDGEKDGKKDGKKDGQKDGQKEDQPVTPTELGSDVPNTPDAPKFAPASPPTTTRRTRQTRAAEQGSPVPSKAPRRSPFDAWRRTKGASSDSHGKKRSGGDLPGEPSSKRTRA